MDFQDPIGVLTPVDVARLCAAHDRPRPRRVAPLAGRGRSAVYTLTFSERSGSPPAALQVELATGVLGSALQHEQVALDLVRGALPTLPPFDRPPRRHGHRWTAIRPARDTVLAADWLARDPEDWTPLAEVLGRALVALEGVTVEGFGLHTDGSRFTPSAPTWRDEWAGYVAALAARARQTGVDMGPHTERLVDAIQSRLAALDPASTWRLVHGNLGPQCLEIPDQDPTRAVVTGWDDAVAGDPLMEVGPLLALQADWLAPVLAAVGGDRVRRWLAPDCLSRIEVYHLTWCLGQLATIGDYYAFDAQLARLGALGGMRGHAQRALEPGFCGARLEDALNLAERGAGTYALAPGDPVAAHLHVALGAVAADAPGRATELAAALGAGLLARRLAPTHPHAAAASVAIGLAAIPVPRARPRARPDTVEDLDAWRRSLGARLDVASDAGLALAWTGLAALDVVGGDVSASCRGSLEERIAAADPEALDPLPARLRALVTLAAVHGLRDLLGEPDALARAARAALGDGPPGGSDWTHDDLVHALQRPPTPHTAHLRPLLLLALESLRGRAPLPGGPAWLLAQGG